MIMPRPRGRICLSAQRVPWTVPKKVTSTIWRNSFGVISSNGLYIDTIALLIQKSTGPEARFHGLRGGLDLVELANVGGNGDSLSAAILDFSFGGFEAVAASCEQTRVLRRAWQAVARLPGLRRLKHR